MAAPLAHVRAVELTDIRGALMGRILADLGAEVIKIEPPDGEDGRARPPFVADRAGPERSLTFLHRNAGKRAVALDLHDRGRARRARRSARRRRSPSRESRTRGARRAHARASRRQAPPPRARSYVSLADFGLSGPRAAWRAEPLVAFAMSGAQHQSGFPDLPPCWLPGYLAHDCGAVFAVAGAIAALLHRELGGGAEAVEVSVQEAAINGLNPWAIVMDAYARLYPIVPSAAPRNADGAYIVLPSADGYLRISRRHGAPLEGLLRAARHVPTRSPARNGNRPCTGS